MTHRSSPNVGTLPACFLCCLAIAFTATSAVAQSGDLAKDIDGLNIRHQTDHYVFAGTVSDDRLAEFGRCLEYIYAEYAEGFAELIGDKEQAAKRGSDRGSKNKKARAEGKKSDGRFRVIVFATEDEYKWFGMKYIGNGAENSLGLFVGSAKLLMVQDGADTDETYSTLFHESFHQFIGRYVPATPTWLNEGLATYYGQARVTPRGLVFDRPSKEHLAAVALALSMRELIPLEELMLSSQRAFYDGSPVGDTQLTHQLLAYAQAYTLVGFILSDKDGRMLMRKYLKKLVNAKSEGEARSITKQIFPESLLEAMVPGWLDWVNRR